MKKRIYSILSLLLVFMLTFACFTGCKDKDEDTSSPNSSVEEVVTLSFSQKTVSLSIGESFQTTLTSLYPVDSRTSSTSEEILESSPLSRQPLTQNTVRAARSKEHIFFSCFFIVPLLNLLR